MLIGYNTAFYWTAAFKDKKKAFDAAMALPPSEMALLRFPGGEVSQGYESEEETDLFCEFCKLSGAKAIVVLDAVNLFSDNPNVALLCRARNAALIQRIERDVEIAYIEVGNEMFQKWEITKWDKGWFASAKKNAANMAMAFEKYIRYAQSIRGFRPNIPVAINYGPDINKQSKAWNDLALKTDFILATHLYPSPHLYGYKLINAITPRLKRLRGRKWIMTEGNGYFGVFGGEEGTQFLGTDAYEWFKEDVVQICEENGCAAFIWHKLGGYNNNPYDKIHL